GWIEMGGGGRRGERAKQLLPVDHAGGRLHLAHGYPRRRRSFAVAASCKRMSHTRLSSALLTKNCPAKTKPPPMTELTIDGGAFATTPTPYPKPCRVAATHAGRKQIDCQGSEANRC